MDKTKLTYYCKDCQTKIHWQTAIYNKGKCRSCSHKYLTGNKNSNYKNGQWIKPHYCSICQKNPISYETWRRKGKKGKCIKCFGKSVKGKNNSMFGKVTHGKGEYYKGIYLHSSYEVAFAYWLDCSGIRYTYEPKRFYFKDCTYLPDFYIPEWGLYIEIKGWFTDKTKKRINKFKKLYPKINFRIFQQRELQKLGVIK